VSATLRVVRLKGGLKAALQPGDGALLTAVADMPSSCAAARKLPRRTTAITTSSSVRPERCIDYPENRNNPCSIAWIIATEKPCQTVLTQPEEVYMHTIEQIFINGEFVTPHGTEWFDLYNPATAQVIGQVRLADEVDAGRAIAAAKAAFPAWSKTTKPERIAALKRIRRRGRSPRRSCWKRSLKSMVRPPRVPPGWPISGGGDCPGR
jgi:hypothetical protein